MTRSILTGGRRIGRTNLMQHWIRGEQMHRILDETVVFTPESIAEIMRVVDEVSELRPLSPRMAETLRELRENSGRIEATFTVDYGEMETRIMREIFARDRASVRPTEEQLHQLMMDSVVRRENPLARHDIDEQLIRPDYCQCCGKPRSQFGSWEAQAASGIETLCFECGVFFLTEFEEWCPEVELEESVDALREMVSRGVGDPPATEALWLRWEERTSHDRNDL